MGGGPASGLTGAADFYYGEMEMRRRALDGVKKGKGGPAKAVEFAILSGYWLISGYGLRASRSLLTLVALIAVATLALHCWGFENVSTLGQAARFAVACATSLVRPVEDDGLTGFGFAVEMVLRLSGPALLALSVLAVRARIKR